MGITKRISCASAVLENDLRQDILTGRLAGGDMLPSENDLSESYGISRNSVRKALSILVDAGFLRKVHGAGTFVIPRNERMAESSVFPESHHGQILFLSLESAMSAESTRSTFEPIYAGLSNLFEERGCCLLFTKVGKDWIPPPCLLRGDVEGLIFHGPVEIEFWRRYIRPLPHVGLQYQNPLLESDFVAMDNYAFSERLVDHLYHLGHRRIGFVTDEIENQLSYERYQAFLGSMKRHGLEVDDRYCLVWQRPCKNGVLGQEWGMPDYTPWLEKAFQGGPPPTAFICSDNNRAKRIRVALEKMGLRVPDDISLTGSSTCEAEQLERITGVDGMLECICREATELLFAGIKQPKNTEFKTVMIHPQFVPGDTTKNIVC